MEKAVGIICEFNPFHFGHAYLFKKVKEAFPEKSIVCVMSGNFVQRGSFAIQEKYSRAKCALLAGADLVLELPYPFSSLSAESFGAAAVSILSAIGVCDTLAFGSESGDKEGLLQAVENLSSPEYQKNLEIYRKNNPGKGYPFARQTVYEEMFGPCDFFSQPNASLGLSYLQAIRYQGADLSPFVVERKGETITSTKTEGDFLSATAIRSLIEKELTFEGKVPDFVVNELEKERKEGRFPVSMESLSTALFYLIKTKSRKELSAYYGFSALSDRAKKFVSQCDTIEELVSKMNSVSFTDSRIRRGLLALLLGTSRYAEKDLPRFSMVLAAGEKGRELLSLMKEKSTIPVFTKPAHPLKCEDALVLKQFSASALADEVYAMAFPQRQTEGYFLKKTPTII